ncbi:MAG: hypothetical protein P8J32_03550 [bacterium]|nr:hypothetical protein [bacterium]
MKRKDLISIIRKGLQENYPAGAANDSRAPWNQEEPRTSTPLKTSNSLNFVAGDESADFLVKSTGRFYVISKENLNNNTELFNDLAGDYGTVPVEPEYDEDGGYDSHNYDEAELSTDELMNAAEDYIEKGQVGTVEDFRIGDHFVFELTPEMAEELWSHGSELEKVPQVNRMIDYNKLRAQYPSAFK